MPTESNRPILPLERANPLHLTIAFASGGLLTLMVLFNGEAGRFGGPVFSSWLAHGTGTLAALVFLALLPRPGPVGDQLPLMGKILPPAPPWAYLGGVCGALIVILTSSAVTTSLALAGTLALGLGGQVAFSLAADHWGLFGFPRRRFGRRDALAILLITAGSLLIILFGQNTAP